MIGAKHRRVDEQRSVEERTGLRLIAERGTDLRHAQQAARRVGVVLAQAGQVTAQRLGEQGPGLLQASGGQVEHSQVPQGVGRIVVHLAQDASADRQGLAQRGSGRVRFAKRLVHESEPIQTARHMAVLSAQQSAVDRQGLFQHPACIRESAGLQRQHADIAQRTRRDRMLAPDGGVEEAERRLEFVYRLRKSSVIVIDPPDMIARDADRKKYGVYRLTNET